MDWRFSYTNRIPFRAFSSNKRNICLRSTNWYFRLTSEEFNEATASTNWYPYSSARSSNFWYSGLELLVLRVRTFGTQGSTNWYFREAQNMSTKPYFIWVSGTKSQTGRYGTYCRYCNHKRRPPFKSGSPSYDDLYSHKKETCRDLDRAISFETCRDLDRAISFETCRDLDRAISFCWRFLLIGRLHICKTPLDIYIILE